MPLPFRGRSMALGGPPRLDYRDLTGVEAMAPSTRPTLRDTLGYAPQMLYSRMSTQTLGPNAYDPRIGRTGRGYMRTRPGIRMGPVPKLSIGSGQTTPQRTSALSYTPAGSGNQDVSPSAGMEMMPYRRDSFDASPVGIPLRGVGATSGAELSPTYKAHDWAWVPRFYKHGRSPGPWQETAFGPGYRYLQGMQTPIKYPLGNAVHLARPLSQNAYFLGYQTTADAYAHIGAGGPGTLPLGY